MFSTPITRAAMSAVAAGAVIVLSSCAAASATTPATEKKPFGEVTKVKTVASFELAQGQLPENIVKAGDGVAVTFAASRQIATISKKGEVDILGTLPSPAEGAQTPVLGFALASGLAAVDGDFFALYATGDAATTGLWKLSNGEFELVAALSADGVPNGLVFDETHDRFLAADSVLGIIYSIGTDGSVETFSDDPALASAGFVGVNGLQLHNGDLFASNLDAGQILQIDIASDGTAGTFSVEAQDVAGIDDFAFTGRGDQIVATINPTSELVLITDGVAETVLTAADGLSNPTSVLVDGRTIWVPSAAYLTQSNPNLLTAKLS